MSALVFSGRTGHDKPYLYMLSFTWLGFMARDKTSSHRLGVKVNQIPITENSPRYAEAGDM